LYSIWQLPSFAAFARRLATGRRLVVLNARGTGLSDQPPGITTEARMDDVRAVMDQIDSARASLLTVTSSTHSGPTTPTTSTGWCGTTDSPSVRARWSNSVASGTRRTSPTFCRRFRAPTLDLSKDDAREECEYITARIHDAQHVVLPGVGVALCETDDAADAIERFLAGPEPHEIPDRVLATLQAGAGEILASSTVKDLVAGSGLAFEDRGTHELKGVPGGWRLYSVVNA
jgi:hypothetical protein